MIKRNLCLEEEKVLPQQYIYLFWELLGVLEKGVLRNVKGGTGWKFFIFRKVSFRSQDNHVSAFLTISWFPKFMKSWWVLVHETGSVSEYIFWTTSVHDKKYKTYFSWIVDIGLRC